jgi:hypothetical protein
MALWLFRRKSRRKRTRGTSPDGEGEDRGRDGKQAPPNRRQTEPPQSQDMEKMTPPKKQRTESSKLQRKGRNHSYSPGRDDAITVDPVRSQRRTSPDGAQKTNNGKRGKENGYRVDSGAALGEDVFPRAPTLHNKRPNDSLPRKKSSKRRRKSDQVREAEIKAMSNFVPRRPATDESTAGRPMKKESRHVRNAMSHPFGVPEWDKENRGSEISLPMAESLASTMSSDSEHVSWKVSAFEALAPRPTLRYDVNPRSGTSLPSKYLSKRTPYPEATLRAHKRVDDLANDLSASDLRELMERDKRRRERKQQKDQEKMERRLARRAERQRSEEALAAGKGGEPPKNLERGVMGRELVGLGIDTTSAVVTSSRRRKSTSSSKRPSKSSSEKGEPVLEKDDEKQAHPYDSFHRTTSIAIETPIAADPDKEIEVVPPLPGKNPLRYKKSEPSSLTDPGAVPDSTDKARRGSEDKIGRRSSLWTSIFRRNSKNGKDRRRSVPPSFSNTSRDSMSAQAQAQAQAQPQPPVVPAAIMPAMRKPSSGVPKRTMSRFREDLPELPPRMPEPRGSVAEAEVPATIAEQSPETDTHQVAAEDDEPDSLDSPGSPVTATNTMRYDTPTSLDRSVEGLRQTPVSWLQRSDIDPSPAPQSMSLASIDSEGSWLSGGRMASRRRSVGMSDTLSRIQDRTSTQGGSDGTFGSAEPDHEDIPEDHSIHDDEYLSRYARHSGTEAKGKRQSVGEGRPSSDEEDAEARWGAVDEKLPTMIHGRSSERLKSREGLLDLSNDDDEEATDEDDAHDDEKEELAVQRATSVNLGKGHVRHISAGSARLLELTPRSSVDVRRRSVGL